jgi:hypothetical protein
MLLVLYKSHTILLSFIITLKSKLYLKIYTNPVRTSQETNYVSATKLKRSVLFRETVAVYCGNHTEHTDKEFSPYLTGNTLRLGYKVKPVNAV